MPNHCRGYHHRQPSLRPRIPSPSGSCRSMLQRHADPDDYNLPHRPCQPRTPVLVWGRHPPLRLPSTKEVNMSTLPLKTPRLLRQVRAVIRALHDSPRTEDACVGWIPRYILFHTRVTRRTWGCGGGGVPHPPGHRRQSGRLHPKPVAKGRGHSSFSIVTTCECHWTGDLGRASQSAQAGAGGAQPR